MSSAFQAPEENDRNDDLWYNFGYGAIEIGVESYSLDGHEGAHGLERDTLLLNDVEWETLTINGFISIPRGLTDFVFEDGVDPGRVAELIVRADCIRTHNRFVVDTIEEIPHAGRTSFEANIDKELVDGKIVLEPVLVRVIEGSTTDYRFGQIPGLKLADGPSFVIDTEGQAEQGTFLPIETRSFGAEREGRIYWLDHSVASNPRLYINSEVELLVSALKSRAPFGAKRWVKESLERLVGQPVWIELVLWTAADITDGECLYEWQEDVVDYLASIHDEPPDIVVARLERQIREPERVDTLVETTAGDAQDILGIDGPLEHLLEEVL